MIDHLGLHQGLNGETVFGISAGVVAGCVRLITFLMAVTTVVNLGISLRILRQVERNIHQAAVGEPPPGGEQ